VSKKYYEKANQFRDENYKFGQKFEYRVMRYLRKRGFHVMRRFGSHGEYVCLECGHRCKRTAKKCPKCGATPKKIPLDLTAYKNGNYYMITCKASKRRGTTWMDDPYYMNLVKYAEMYDAIPTFAGHTEDNEIYFVDLRNLSVFEPCYRYKADTRPDEQQMERLIEEAWKTLEKVNELINYAWEHDDIKEMRRWVNTKVNLINIINRLLWRAGKNVAAEDLTSLLKQVEQEGEEHEDVQSG